MYAIELAPEFTRQVANLHPRRYKQIHLRIFALQRNPRPPDSVMLDPERHVVRVGPYAIVYRIYDSLHRVHVLLLNESIEE